MRIVALILCIPAIVGCSIPRFHSSRTVKQTLETQPLQMVDLSTFNGDVKVLAHDAPNVEMTVVYKAYGESEGDAQAKCEQLECDISAENGVLTIRAVKPRGVWMASAAFELMVPAYCQLKLKSSNGDMRVEDLEAPVDLSTSNGGVKLVRVSEAMKAHTSNGKIEVDDCIGTINASTSNGRVYFSGMVVGVDNKISTSNGRVYLELPESALTEVSTKTSNGSIKCTLPTQKILSESKRSFHAIVGSADPQSIESKLVVNTSNGSININPWNPSESETEIEFSDSAEIVSSEELQFETEAVSN